MMELNPTGASIRAFPVPQQSRPPFATGSPQRALRLNPARVPVQVIPFQAQTWPVYASTLGQNKQSGSVVVSARRLPAPNVVETVLPTPRRGQAISSPPMVTRCFSPDIPPRTAASCLSMPPTMIHSTVPEFAATSTRVRVNSPSSSPPMVTRCFRPGSPLGSPASCLSMPPVTIHSAASEFAATSTRVRVNGPPSSPPMMARCLSPGSPLRSPASFLSTPPPKIQSTRVRVNSPPSSPSKVAKCLSPGSPLRSPASFLSTPPATIKSTAKVNNPTMVTRCNSGLRREPSQLVPTVKQKNVGLQNVVSAAMPAFEQQKEKIAPNDNKFSLEQYSKADLGKLPPHVHSTVDKITQCLQDRNKLKDVTVHLFKQAASDDSNSSLTCKVEDMGLDIYGLMKFVDLISIDLDVPPYAFGSLEDSLNHFDFIGQGSLNVNSAYRLVKSFLWQYRYDLGGELMHVKIPWQSPSESGYDIVKELGHGSQGTAKLAKNKSGDEICLKVFHKKNMDEDGIQQLLKEFKAMRMLSCELIAGAHALFQDDTCFYVASDLLQGGDLSTLAERAEEQGVNMSVAWWRDIFLHCIAGLAFMHAQGMIHCDIKESNIMLKSADFSAPQIVIIDLGVCKSVATLDDGIPFGTPGYVPPETLADMRWYPRGDIFSLGVTIFQILCQMQPPSNGLFLDGCTTRREIFQATIRRDPKWEKFPEMMGEFKDIVANMLAKDRMQRPRAPKLLTYDWFTEAEPAGKDAIPISGMVTSRAIEQLYARLKPCNDFASMGITRDMLADLDKN